MYIYTRKLRVVYYGEYLPSLPLEMEVKHPTVQWKVPSRPLSAHQPPPPFPLVFTRRPDLPTASMTDCQTYQQDQNTVKDVISGPQNM